MARIRVLLTNTALGPLDYRLDPGIEAPPGTLVEVPLGPRRMLGCVWDEGSESAAMAAESVGDNRLRPIFGTYPMPPLPLELRRLIEWTADYYLAPAGAVLRMVVPGVALRDGGRPIIEYRATGTTPPRMTPQRSEALEKIGERQGSLRDLADMSGASEAVLRGLIKAGALEAIALSPDVPPPLPDPAFAPPALSEEQAAASATFRSAINAGFQPFLLDGVTGSGKTEVYFEAVAEAIRQGKQSVILLPEIALTEPMLRRFEARFGCAPVAWHSGLRQTERRANWRAIASGEALVTIGARSALFLPYANLGLIVVDEAHEASFKQEDGVHYHARDVAVMRAKFADVPIILASATPAIESRAQVEAGRYREIQLPARFGGATLPAIRAIDLRNDPPDRGAWISPPLVAELSERLERGEQSLLFLNRRGYAPLTLCRTCGHRIECPNCTAWMVEHRLARRLSCHHCGHVMPPPRLCPECQNEDTLVACGPGVERVADEVKARWPEARTAIVTSDTLWSPARAAEFVEHMEAGMIDIVIGTQLVTKGYHFPNLTLVGVIDADIGLSGGDLRASERSFQQIAQVAGRAGRGDKPGEVLIQTRQPEAPVMAALIAGDSAAFYAAETEARKDARMPPYGRLAAIIISSEDAVAAERAAKAIGAAAPDSPDMEVWGPVPAPLAMLRGRHRHRLLVHAARNFPLQKVMREWLGACEWPAKVRVAVDVDPYSFV
ncbi:primosomal protein N' [Sphingomonas lacunae]|uniref:Replication restart protein PriA n=1 Tax=Sphingomonas lacunae TaxID=2698828 RepID=A0A6M4B2U1_9SPHN|nr:primosomal protein N' [Sphingomonas lacunae]QJQ33781.1 primosomal protein N' [Sphingomonas lacunae]